MTRSGAREVRTRRGLLRPPGPHGDQGLSLTELLVSMVLFGIIGTLVVTVYTATTSSVQKSVWRQDNTRLAQVGMENLTKSIRSTTKIERNGATALPGFTEATATTIEVYSFLGTRPTKIRYAVDTQQRLIETRVPADTSSTAPYWTFTGAGTSRIVIDRVVNTSTQRLFSYRDGTGATVVPVTGDTTSLDAVRGVDITLVVQTRIDGKVPAAAVQQLVYLPNLGSIG